MSKHQTYSFGKLPTLSTTYWYSDKLRESWKWRERSMETVMQKFIDLNKRNLDYLGITVSIETMGGKLALKIVTSKYIGTIPIKSPMNGKEVGDLVVVGRFGEDASELINLLDSSVRPEYSDEFRLVQDSQLTPPIYIECCKFVDLYLQAEKSHWNKFTNRVESQREPSASTMWGEYALRKSRNPLEFTKFRNKRNILTSSHPEWAQLNFVLKNVIRELESSRTPLRTRLIYSSQMSLLKIRLNDKAIIPTDHVRIHMSDPLVIKQLKEVANIILNNKVKEKLAWRLDYAEFFERYIQYLLGDVAKKKGAQVITNPHYGISVDRLPAWGLNYLEPDLILQKSEEQIVIDAKYKSHMFNWYDYSDELKETFRHDLHQVLAYCSLNALAIKRAIIAYPYNEFFYRKMRVSSPLASSTVTVYLIGVPLEKQRINEIKDGLNKIITFTS